MQNFFENRNGKAVCDGKSRIDLCLSRLWVHITASSAEFTYMACTGNNANMFALDGEIYIWTESVQMHFKQFCRLYLQYQFISWDSLNWHDHQVL